MASSILSESLQGKGHLRSGKSFGREIKNKRREKESEKGRKSGCTRSIYVDRRLEHQRSVYVCVHKHESVQTQRWECVEVVKEHVKPSPSPPRWVSTEVLHFDPVSAHLPGGANWVRQMEWKHERSLIPLWGFWRQEKIYGDLGSPRRFLWNIYSLLFWHALFSNIYRAEPLQCSVLLIHYFSVNQILNYV